jgi:RNA-binding protein YlmH
LENPFKAPEERLLFAKALDRFSIAQKRSLATFTDFLDPVRCEAFFSLLAKNAPRDFTVSCFGGFDAAERKMIGFNAEDSDFPVTPLEFTYNMQFSAPPSHRDYLGAVLGLGLERAKIGDIRLCDSGAVMYAASDIADFICENLLQVKRTAVKVRAVSDFQDISQTAQNEKRITVASLRLDGVISSAFNISRGKAAALIESEKVFINWKLAKKTQLVSEGDTITIRGKGRVTVNGLEGNTKKDRIVLRVAVFL